MEEGGLVSCVLVEEVEVEALEAVQRGTLALVMRVA